MDSERIKDSIPAGNDGIDDSEEIDAMEESNDRHSKMLAWKEVGTSIISFQSPTSSSAYSSNPFEISEPSSAPANKKTPPRKNSKSPTSSSGYSSIPFDVSEPSSAPANRKTAPGKKGKAKQAVARTGGPSYREIRDLKPAPYFYYIDHSQDVDDDPLAPLSPALSVPNFLIKLHAILICDSLSGVIEWMPHGRSWKILNQVKHRYLASSSSYIDLTLEYLTCLSCYNSNHSFLDLAQSEFEKQVLPTYFRQGSIASFYRQANGWGFRREPSFMRQLPRNAFCSSFQNNRHLTLVNFPSVCVSQVCSRVLIKDRSTTNVSYEAFPFCARK